MSLGLGRLKLGAVVAAGFLLAAHAIPAGDLPGTFGGNLLGSVEDTFGTPQMSATVLLFDRYDRLVRRTLTTPDGRFGFSALSPSVYSIKISVPSFIPATREKIMVQAGLSSILQIRLASVFSSVELQYTKPTASISDDWKWVLRSSASTRLITRELPQAHTKSVTVENPQKIFTDTRGSLSMSAGDAGSLLADVGLADFGTSFALATTVYGRNKLMLSGAYGQSIQSGMPSMGVRATYARTNSAGDSAMPELTVTAQQVALPNRLINYPGPDGNPSVRSTSLSYYDTMDVGGLVHLEYGSAIDSVSYVGEVNRISPYARASAALGSLGTISAAFSNGGNPTELYTHQLGEDADLPGTVGALSTVPAFSLRDSRLQLQRTQNAEIGFVRTVGSRTYAASVFHENVSDGRLNVSGDLSSLDPGSVVSDVSTSTYIYNIRRYQRNGGVLSVCQKLGDNLNVTVSGGEMGGFTRASGSSDSSVPLHRREHAIASVGFQATVPGARTRLMGNYEYVADGALIPRHIFSTQRLYDQPGLNLIVRQPLPSLFGLGKLELSADVRNLLAQGYLPVSAGDNRRMLLVQSARAIRGGLNIIF